MSPRGGRRSLFQRVFVMIFGVVALVVIVFTVTGSTYLHRQVSDITRGELMDEARIVASTLNKTVDDVDVLQSLALEGKRATLVDVDGSVVFDTEKPVETLENHADRPEVVQAREEGIGFSERSSFTLGETMLYQAVRLENGMVLRLAQEQDSLFSIMLSLAVPFLVLALVLLAISFFAARRAARTIIAPLIDVDLDHPKRKRENMYSEMVPMLDRIESQRQELKRQMAVLADNDRMRREFTANITHELKTPLTTISGYAELIAEGMVSDESDLKDFGGRIHREARRLTSLVNDILTLSNLDEVEHSEGEGASAVIGSTEPVDLPRLITAIEQRLEHMAAKAQVTIETDLDPAMVVGVPRLLDELVYNLASNAIRYNQPEGSVRISCGFDGDQCPYVRVADTGIGIAPEEQGKVFARFYRVDKSRSKARGGTGLGLAIVKHAAVFHGARIDMESALGEGTTITVIFPKQQALAL